MESLSKRAKVLEKKPMTLAERAYLPAIFQGLSITMQHFFRAATKKQVTIRYPEETRPFSPVFRGLHVLKRDEKGRERCTACGLCAVALTGAVWLSGGSAGADRLAHVGANPWAVGAALLGELLLGAALTVAGSHLRSRRR